MEESGVQLRSLTEGIDTSTTNGKLTFHLFAALPEFERALVRERTRAGLEAARARGRMGGRKLPRQMLCASLAASAGRSAGEAITLLTSRTSAVDTVFSAVHGARGGPAGRSASCWPSVLPRKGCCCSRNGRC
jgi:hypothetical protein